MPTTQLTGSLECTLKVTQFHFTAWPDHEVPDYATSLLAFHKKLKKHHSPSMGPLLVHCRYTYYAYHNYVSVMLHAKVSLITCSAGVGRTGTLVTIDRVLDQHQQERVVDIAGTICHLRTQRIKMVQSVVCIYYFP